MTEQQPTVFAQDDEAGKTASFSGPAFYSNRVYLSLTPVTGRLSFVEYPPLDTAAQPQFRTAVTMSIGDLIALRELLSRALQDVRQLTEEHGNGSAQ
jgi:hypothetical protein